MNKIFFHCCILVSVSHSFGQIIPKETPELKYLREQYQNKLSLVISPIQSHYISDLKKLQAQLAQKNNLSGALAVQQEIDTSTETINNLITPIRSQSKLNGTIWFSEGSDFSKIQFLSNGQFRETWHNQTGVGTWKPLSDIKVEVTRENGRLQHFTLDPEKDSLWREEEPVGWHRTH
jgi:hypothetical protein